MLVCEGTTNVLRHLAANAHVSRSAFVVSKLLDIVIGVVLQYSRLEFEQPFLDFPMRTAIIRYTSVEKHSTLDFGTAGVARVPSVLRESEPEAWARTLRACLAQPFRLR